MRRVLIVTSSYAPTAIADMHRARHLAWELPAHGWDVEVLFPDQSFQRPEFTEPGTAWLFAPQTPLHPAPPAAAWLFELARMRSIGWRAWWPLLRAGSPLLRSGRFDLVYITTGHFPLFTLGPSWKRQFGVPYILDYHDPWIRTDTGSQTTRGGLKRQLANALAHSIERAAVTQADGFVSVSSAYLDELRARYGQIDGLAPSRCDAIAFAGSPHDFAPGSSRAAASDAVEVVYVGAGGAIMRRSFAAICRALAALRHEAPALVDGVRIRLVGTDGGWSEGGPRPLQDLAASYGVGDLVTEEPRRITYTAAMSLIQASRGLLVLGVDDGAYVPSKLFTYALTGLPLLAALRAESPAVDSFAAAPSMGHVMTFGADDRDEPGHVAVMRAFLTAVRVGTRRAPGTDLAPFLAPGMAARHAALFNRIVDAGRGGES